MVKGRKGRREREEELKGKGKKMVPRGEISVMADGGKRREKFSQKQADRSLGRQEARKLLKKTVEMLVLAIRRSKDDASEHSSALPGLRSEHTNHNP